MRRLQPRGRRTGEALPRMVLVFAVLAALLRAAYVQAPMSPDEGGFLVVAGHWHPGSSLYGNYWVDRPPLLIALFRVADLFGGLTALRLLGSLAAALTVLGVGLAARRLASTAETTPAGRRRAAIWAAGVAAALLVSPLAGGSGATGELLAAPFIAAGIWCALVAVGEAGRVAVVAAVAAGACAAAAILVKQNMLDVIVFAGVLGGAAAVGGAMPLRLLVRRTLQFAAGGLGLMILVLLPAYAAGTTPWGVYVAMYPFRLQAATLMQSTGVTHRLEHLRGMVLLWTTTGAPVVVAVFATWAFRRAFGRGRRITPAVLALGAVLAYDVVSIGAGGSFWLHYLFQLAVPTALAAGVLAAQVPRLGRALGVLVLVLCSAAWVGGLFRHVYAPGASVGAAVGAAARPGDGIVSLLGDADIVKTSGLSSPYTYLWSLPSRVRDPHLHELTGLLRGPKAPGWIVLRGPNTERKLYTGPAATVLRTRYHPVATLCQRKILLRNDLRRPDPTLLGNCTRPIAPWLGGPTINGVLP